METSSHLFKGETRHACIGVVPHQVFVLIIGVISAFGNLDLIPLILITPITHFI
ncbi:hypothetical protein [Parasutterella sp.]|uniref:hypothetical protein n=1 Tax=Parasutterella sp. TaxID=2049037 RepID=UPI0039968CEF